MVVAQLRATLYNIMSDFLVSNMLKLNDDNTHLMVMTTSQARTKRKGTNKDFSKVQIRTPSKIIEPSECEKLLGCWLHQDMKFAENIQNNQESLLRSLYQRIGALQIVGKVRVDQIFKKLFSVFSKQVFPLLYMTLETTTNFSWLHKVVTKVGYKKWLQMLLL